MGSKNPSPFNLRNASGFYERRNMKLINFILWLSAGAFIGWIAGWMAEAERRRLNITPVAIDLPD
jgi:hypothetical protein